jgi:hypothetical protein
MEGLRAHKRAGSYEQPPSEGLPSLRGVFNCVQYETYYWLAGCTMSTTFEEKAGGNSS